MSRVTIATTANSILQTLKSTDSMAIRLQCVDKELQRFRGILTLSECDEVYTECVRTIRADAGYHG